MKTVLYLLRHGATEANLAEPYRLQGAQAQSTAGRMGIRQAESTGDFLVIRPIDYCYCSPLWLRVSDGGHRGGSAWAVSSAHRIAHRMRRRPVGKGLDWQAIRYFDAESYLCFHADPATHGYPGGESFQQVFDRAYAGDRGTARPARRAFHARGCASHRESYLSGQLARVADGQGEASLTRQLRYLHGRKRDSQGTSVSTLNATFHLQGLSLAA